MRYAILLDFGSTYTKIVCVDLSEKRVVLTDKFPSTVHTDAGISLQQCFEAAKCVIGDDDFGSALKLSTSSAAGGLRIAVSGLTKSLSIEAGRNASFGAGGKIVYTASGLISEKGLQGIEGSQAEILLLCGGYEGGNSKAVLHNAEVLADSSLNIPIIYAGNSRVAKDVRMLFAGRGKECFMAENIIPDVGVLNIEPTVAIMRDLFMNRITNMKGVGKVKKLLDGPIIPTPAAVLAAGQLLCLGTETEPGIGPYMMADIGGATTDIYSFIENRSYEGAKQVGSPEPFAKRTVEGDMGMRESSVCLVKEVGEENFARKCCITKEHLRDAIENRITDRKYIAEIETEKEIDLQIACSAVEISARRHAGYAAKEFHDGCRLVQHGKNLTEIKTVIGTGGILVNNLQAAPRILQNVRARPSKAETVLLPSDVKTFVDEDYVFFAAGLLSDYDQEAALAIMKNSIGTGEKNGYQNQQTI
ncbi:MAG: glutamate mutase L [Emergencia timonensis]|uniref:glutamate mutase L n=1 Tax=Emergencia timonensis TaxID=1776384 RepID=UPI000831E42D|nr:glutamate mutase L [Emergencia timonensis]WNX88876.1 glutamate mutase L [Emergencia timonensis]